MPEKIKKKKKLNTYILFRPYITRLFTYVVLFYISRNNYMLFKDNQHSYIPLIDLMNQPLLVDIQFVDLNGECPGGYKEVNSTVFEDSYGGCNCDGEIVKDSQCGVFEITEGLGQCNYYQRLINFSNSDNNSSSSTSHSENQKVNCNKCYSKYNGLPNNQTIKYFYGNQKPCLLYDNLQSTFTYLDSVSAKCDMENLCNDFFCKQDNNPANRCPITVIMNKESSNVQDLQSPFAFSASYLTYDTLDSNYHGYIYTPVTDIRIGKNGLCNSGAKYESSYPLVKINDCQLSSRFYNFDTASLQDILKYNNVFQTVNSSLPFFEAITKNETWYLTYQSAFSRETLYCLINKHNLFLDLALSENNNTFNMSHINDYRQRFAEAIDVYTNLGNNSKFQEQVQTTIYYVSIIITSFEIAYVLIKMFNICGDRMKILLCILSYEGYLAFSVDIFYVIVTGVVHKILYDYMLRIEELIQTGCLDDYVSGKLTIYKIATEVVADKTLEMFLIIMTKLVIIGITLTYYCIVKKGGLNFRGCEQIIFEKEEEEEEKDDCEDKKKKQNLEKKRKRKKIKRAKKYLSDTIKKGGGNVDIFQNLKDNAYQNKFKNSPDFTNSYLTVNNKSSRILNPSGLLDNTTSNINLEMQNIK